MSDVSFDPEDYVAGPDGKLQEKQEPVSSKWRRDLEKRAKKGDEAIAEAAALRKQLAFMKAGIPSDGIGELFLKAYDGPTDDEQAIKEAAIKYGILKPSESHQQQVDQALAGHEAGMAAASGQLPTQGDDIKAKLAQAKSAADVARIMHEAGIPASALPGFPDLRK